MTTMHPTLVQLLPIFPSTHECIKCAIQHDLLFQEPAPSSMSEAEETSNQELEDVEELEESDVEEFLWDGLLIEDDNDNGETMYWSE